MPIYGLIARLLACQLASCLTLTILFLSYPYINILIGGLVYFIPYTHSFEEEITLLLLISPPLIKLYFIFLYLIRCSTTYLHYRINLYRPIFHEHIKHLDLTPPPTSYPFLRINLLRINLPALFYTLHTKSLVFYCISSKPLGISYTHSPTLTHCRVIFNMLEMLNPASLKRISLKKGYGSVRWEDFFFHPCRRTISKKSLYHT